MLDTKNGDVYVFGGQDSANPPVPAPDDILSSGFYTQINTAVSALSTNGAAATAAATPDRRAVKRGRHVAIFGLYVAAGVRH